MGGVLYGTKRYKFGINAVQSGINAVQNCFSRLTVKIIWVINSTRAVQSSTKAVLRWRQVHGLVDRIDDDEIVTRAMHFGEVKCHPCILNESVNLYRAL